jgi:hypothetical protein
VVTQHRFVMAIAVVLASAAVAFDATMPIRPVHKTEIQMAVPPAVAARLTGGYRNMMAVISWIRLISYYGGTDANKRDYHYIAKDLETIVAMNPRFKQAYYMAGIAMPWATNSTILARKLLPRAMRIFPDEWRWPYYLGFDIYFFDHDKVEAARYLTMAATKKEVPPIVAPMLASLALRMQAAGHDLDTALAVINQLMRRKQDASLLQTLDRQRKAILTEKVLRHFDGILAELPPASAGENRLQRLRQYHIPIPAKLPDGGHMIVNARGQLVSSVSGRRYQVFRKERRHQ